MTPQRSGAVVTLAMLGLFLWLLGELRYLAPYSRGLLARHGWHILLFFAALSFNLLVAVEAVGRRLRLATAGQKLRQLDHEIERGDHDLAPEITDAA